MIKLFLPGDPKDFQSFAHTVTTAPRTTHRETVRGTTIVDGPSGMVPILTLVLLNATPDAGWFAVHRRQNLLLLLNAAARSGAACCSGYDDKILVLIVRRQKIDDLI